MVTGCPNVMLCRLFSEKWLRCVVWFGVVWCGVVVVWWCGVCGEVVFLVVHCVCTVTTYAGVLQCCTVTMLAHVHIGAVADMQAF